MVGRNCFTFCLVLAGAGLMLGVFPQRAQAQNKPAASAPNEQLVKEIEELQSNARLEDARFSSQREKVQAAQQVVDRLQKEYQAICLQQGKESAEAREASAQVQDAKGHLLDYISQRDHTLYRLG